jgi:hypothetical protein
MRSAKLEITYDDDIRRFFVEIESFNPLKVIVKDEIDLLLDGARKLQIQYFDEGMLVKETVEIDKIADGYIIFKGIETEKEYIDRKALRVDLKGLLSVKKINPVELSKYREIVDEQNNAEKKSIICKIHESLANTTDEQKTTILLFLIELNEKIEKVINLLEKAPVDSNLFLVKLVDISGGGVCFFTELKEFDVDDDVYIKMNVQEFSFYIKCSMIGKIVQIEQTGKGFLYGVCFEHLDMDMREAIIKFVLEKERFLVREYKLK